MFIVVGIINWVAVSRDLYWSIKELDSLVHFLAGILVSLFFLWLYFFSGFFNPQKRTFREFFKISLLAVIFVGISWETFELTLGETKILGRHYPYDVTLDIIMDILGAILGCFYGYLKEVHEREKNNAKR